MWLLLRTHAINSLPTLQWRHNGRDGVSNHQPHDSLLNCLYRRRSKKTSKPRVTGLCARNSPVTDEFPAQRASNAEKVSIWWRHHVVLSTHTRRTWVLNFWYSYFTRTREFQRNSTHTCTRTWGQILRHSSTSLCIDILWYISCIWDYKDGNHHTCEINSLTFHKGKVPNWFILLWFEYMIHGMWLQILQILLNSIITEEKLTELL